MIAGVLFDMDGTMFDTEDLWGVINRRLAESYGLVWDESVRTQMMGKKDCESLAVFKEFFALDVSVDELVMKRREMILADLSAVRVNDGLLDLLDLLDRGGVKKAVATSSFREFATKLLNEFDVARRFDAIVTGDDVQASKPDPAIFLEAARRIGITPAECLVLEDAQNGVEAAYNAGMRVYAIPHDDSRHHDFSKATKVIASMREVLPDFSVTRSKLRIST